jgi:hypothetical protein
MWKETLGIAAIALTFLAFGPYVRSILRGHTRPHVFSWIIWGSTTFVVFLAQMQANGGAGAWPIGVSGSIAIFVAVLAYTKKGDGSITNTDWWFLGGAMTSLPLWYITADPLWAVFVLTSVDVLGFGPTIRKAYRYPFEEQMTFYSLFVARNALAIAALEDYSATTVLFPAATGVACLFLIAVIGWRRRALVLDKCA